MADAKKGDFVQIHKVILESNRRPENLPSSTKSVPYECWIKGFLINDAADIGKEVRIETFAGRELSGTLYRINPTYDHNFGKPQKELLRIGSEVKHQLEKHYNDIRGK
jgi:hypothetical protein